MGWASGIKNILNKKNKIMELTITRQVQQTEVIKLPLFLLSKCKSTGSINAVAVLDENTMLCVDVMEGRFVYVSQSSFSQSRIDMLSNVEQITEEEFFQHYNKAVELLSVTPKLKS